MDIGFGDVIVPDTIEMEYPSLLEMEKPIIKAYSLESVIAEKFQAMIYLSEANSRMKDFYDIYSLSQSYNFDGTILKKLLRVPLFIEKLICLSHQLYLQRALKNQ